jgi:uncharacterized protein YndB with AHSA1/START domain
MPTFHLAQPVAAPRAAVWRACATPEGLAAWQADAASGDLRAGGSLLMEYRALGARLELEVVDVVMEQRLVLRAGERTVTFLLDDGGLSLSHSDLPAGDEYVGTGSGWALSLATLAHYCETHGERPRSVHWLVGRAPTDAATAHVFFSEADALSAWLGEGSAVAEPGSPVALTLRGGVPLSGKVLSHTPGRDVLLSWREDSDSVLALRTLPSPVSDSERFVILTWSRWSEAPPLDGAWSQLQAAHHRLLKLLSAPQA